MILVFDFRALGGGETEPPHDVLEFPDRLRQRMATAQGRSRSGKRDIERAGRQLWPAQKLLPRIELGRDAIFDFIESPTPQRLLLFARLAEQCLQVA